MAGKFWTPNLSRAGRWLRGLGGLTSLAGGLVLVEHAGAAGWLLAGLGVFMLVEAMRGWCLLRACGIKTKI